MESITEDQLKIDNLKIKIYMLELQLNIAEKATANYRQLSRDQEQRIIILITRLNEIILLSQEVIDNHY